VPTGFGSENLKGRDNLGDVVVNGKVIRRAGFYINGM
jgi:hypothetical protein